MNTASKVLLLVLLFAAPAFAQNVRVDNVTFSSVQGFPFLPGATITICTAAATGLPCSPTVTGTCLSISDATCNQSATITSDALGNYGFWIQPGSYSYTVTKAGFGGFGPKPLTLSCQPTASCTITGALTINSPGSITAGAGVSTSLTNLTVSGTGTLAKVNGVCAIDGTTNTTLAAAVTCAGANGVVDVPMFAVPTLTASVTIPAGVILKFEGGSPGLIQLGNFNLTINGPLLAAPVQIFSYTGTGTVSISNLTKPINAAWFPSAASNNDMCGQIDAAYNAMVVSNELVFPPSPTNAGWSCVTGIAFTHQDIYVRLTCNPPTQVGGPTGGGCTINWTPITAPATTAASVSANVATLTLNTNPQTFGYVLGEMVNIAGFTGADTYFNGYFNLTAVTSTTISYALAHANASATSNGTAAPTAITLDYSGIGGQQAGHGLQGFKLTNNNCGTDGGCGSAANGIIYGNTNNVGAAFADFTDIQINGFNVGEQPAVATTYGIVHWNAHYLFNTIGYQQTFGQEMVSWIGGEMTRNGHGYSATNTSLAFTDVSFNNFHFDDNTIDGVNCVGASGNQTFINFKDVHFENLAGHTQHYINTSGGVGCSVNVEGVTRFGSHSSGVGNDWMITCGGNNLNVFGAHMQADNAMTNAVIANTPCRGELHFVNDTSNTIPTVLAGTSVNMSNFTINGLNGGGNTTWSIGGTNALTGNTFQAFNQGIFGAAADQACASGTLGEWVNTADALWSYCYNAGATQHVPIVTAIQSQYTNSTTTFSTITDGTRSFLWAVAANRTYRITCHLYYQAAATAGLNIQFTGPASPTAVAYGLNDPSAATTFNSAVATAFGTSLGQAAATNGVNFDASVSFTLINGANAGTVALQAKSSAAAQLQIQAASACQVQ